MCQVGDNLTYSFTHSDSALDAFMIIKHTNLCCLIVIVFTLRWRHRFSVVTKHAVVLSFFLLYFATKIYARIFSKETSMMKLKLLTQCTECR